MTYDIICLVMVLLAFIGGFQKGVVKIISFFVAVLIAAITVSWSAPYLDDFLTASITDAPNWLGSALLFSELIVLSLLAFGFLRLTWKPKKTKENGLWQNALGGLLFSIFMLLSMAILSGFADQTNILTERIKQESLAYKILDPVQQHSRQIWENLTSHATLNRHNEPKIKAASIDG